jgi:hypothetical protein
MTDLELTKACVEVYFTGYDPLYNDAQAMALVKKFKLCIDPFSEDGSNCWVVWHPSKDVRNLGGLDLNRAIVECVAKLRSAK